MVGGLEGPGHSRRPGERPPTVARFARTTPPPRPRLHPGETVIVEPPELTAAAPWLENTDGELLSLIEHVRALVAVPPGEWNAALAIASLNRMEYIVRARGDRNGLSQADRLKRTGRIADFFGGRKVEAEPQATEAGTDTGRRRSSCRAIVADAEARPGWRDLLLDRTVLAAVAFAVLLVVAAGAVVARGTTPDSPRVEVNR